MVPSAVGEKVLENYRNAKVASKAANQSGRIERVTDSWTAHQNLVLATVDVERVRKRKFRVLLNSNHGSGSVLGRPLLESLGCELVSLGDKPDGQFEHPPEPTAENLAGVLPKVPANKCDIGFCQDPDADRLAVIDEKGAIHWRGIYAGDLCRSFVATKAGAGGDELLDEPYDRGPGEKIWRAVLSIGSG